jgi:hypothetical protein
MSWRRTTADRILHQNGTDEHRRRSARAANEDCKLRRILNLGASILIGLAFAASPVFEHPVSRLSTPQDAAQVHAPIPGQPLALQQAALPSLESDGDTNNGGPSCAPAMPGDASGSGATCLTSTCALAAGDASRHTGQRLPRWGTALPPPSRHSA